MSLHTEFVGGVTHQALTPIECRAGRNHRQPMALEIGSRLGHYEVTALIGEGGMGQVYRATDTKLDRDVALKVLPQACIEDPALVG